LVIVIRDSNHYLNKFQTCSSKQHATTTYACDRSKKKSSYLPDVSLSTSDELKLSQDSLSNMVNRMDEPLSSSILSTSLHAPSHSFGKSSKQIEKQSLGPGPGAYDVAASKLTSVGDNSKLLLAHHGSPAFTFGGGSDGRDAHPVVDRKKGVIYGPAAPKQMTDAEKREAALRGMGVVRKFNIVPGVGTYDVDLSSKLDAALSLTRKLTQFPPKKDHSMNGSSSSVTMNTTIGLEGSRSISLAVAQCPVSPAFSFSSTVSCLFIFNISFFFFFLYIYICYLSSDFVRTILM
jgi:hypothetical protein